MKYMLVREVYATHEHVTREPKPIKTFDTLTDARAYGYSRAPKDDSWWILAQKGRANDRFYIIVGEMWRKDYISMRTGKKETMAVYLPTLRYGDRGAKRLVNPDGTLGRLY